MKNVEQMIQELLSIDPSFKQHETELRTLIAEFLQKKPDTRLDEEFVMRLRSRLLGAPTPSPFMQFAYVPYMVAVLAVLLVLPIGYMVTRGPSGSAVFAMNQEIEHLGSGAFGTLQQDVGGLPSQGRGGGIGLESSIGTAPMTMAASDTAAAPIDPPQTTEPAKISASMAYGMGGGSADASMIYPAGAITVTSYTYKGEALELLTEGQVYSRVKNPVSSLQIASQLKKFNFGLVNLNGLTDLRVRSFELVEDKPYGYSISASFDEGMISINPNYSQWPGLNGKEIQQQLPISVMLKDADVIAIAKGFLNDHNISLANYDEPIVQQYAEYGIADSGIQYAPDQITVTYPLKISGTPVNEDGGMPYGLQVSVSVRDKKAMSVYGLTSQTYTSSTYTLETDSDKIISIAQRGGVHAWVPQESDGVQIKKVEAELGTPTKVLMHTFNYKDNNSQELFVPALSFPVTKAPAGEQHYPNQIVIPLVPDLLVDNGGPVMYDMLK
jgi:hypothetical protein